MRGGFFPNCPIQNAQSRSLARIADENIGHATVLCMDAAEPSRINPHLLAGGLSSRDHQTLALVTQPAQSERWSHLGSDAEAG